MKLHPSDRHTKQVATSEIKKDTKIANSIKKTGPV